MSEVFGNDVKKVLKVIDHELFVCFEKIPRSKIFFFQIIVFDSFHVTLSLNSPVQSVTKQHLRLKPPPTFAHKNLVTFRFLAQSRQQATTKKSKMKKTKINLMQICTFFSRECSIGSVIYYHRHEKVRDDFLLTRLMTNFNLIDDRLGEN